uniref:Uncharacterized protein n=1 Tax=Ixodes ricinus TaxID=34613 RepID=A0A6B0UM93_IXORI
MKLSIYNYFHLYYRVCTILTCTFFAKIGAQNYMRIQSKPKTETREKCNTLYKVASPTAIVTVYIHLPFAGIELGKAALERSWEQKKLKLGAGWEQQTRFKDVKIEAKYHSIFETQRNL